MTDGTEGYMWEKWRSLSCEEILGACLRKGNVITVPGGEDGRSGG